MPGDMITDLEKWLRGSLGLYVGGGTRRALSLGASVLFDLKAKGWNTEVEICLLFFPSRNFNSKLLKIYHILAIFCSLPHTL